MRAFGSICALVALVAVLGAALARGETRVSDGIRVGVFDSRALAVAYAASDANERKLDELRAKRERYEEEGDERGAEQVEATGKALQVARR